MPHHSQFTRPPKNQALWICFQYSTTETIPAQYASQTRQGSQQTVPQAKNEGTKPYVKVNFSR